MRSESVLSMAAALEAVCHSQRTSDNAEGWWSNSNHVAAVTEHFDHTPYDPREIELIT